MCFGRFLEFGLGLVDDVLRRAGEFTDCIIACQFLLIILYLPKNTGVGDITNECLGDIRASTSSFRLMLYTRLDTTINNIP